MLVQAAKAQLSLCGLSDVVDFPLLMALSRGPRGMALPGPTCPRFTGGAASTACQLLLLYGHSELS